MATAVGNVSMVKNAATAITVTAATATGANGKETFTFTPAKGADKYLILIDNVSDANGTVTFTVAAGDFWAAPAAALAISVAQGVQSGVVLETAKYLQSDGTISIEAKPATGKILKTDHALTLTAVQL